MKEMNCPLCYEVIYSGVGKGCKMCGMPLEDKGKIFCSKRCRIVWKRIKNTKSLYCLGDER